MPDSESNIVLDSSQDKQSSNDRRERRISSAVSRYGNRLLGFIRNRVRTNADAEDIAQEVWYQFSRVADLEAIEQVSGWLFRVARNKVTDEYRRKREDSLEDLDFSDGEGDEHFRDILLSEFTDSEDEDLKELFWQQLFSALDELPEKQRQVFIWNELENETFQEIADRTGENIKTLISRKRYAVQHLRSRLQLLYDEFLLH